MSKQSDSEMIARRPLDQCQKATATAARRPPENGRQKIRCPARELDRHADSGIFTQARRRPKSSAAGWTRKPALLRRRS